MTERIEAQIERFAPGFRDLVLARSTFTAVRGGAQPELCRGRHQRGAATLRQMIFRPTCGGTPTARRSGGSTSARRRRHRAAACTACAGWGRRRAALDDLGLRTTRRPMTKAVAYAWYRLRATVIGTSYLLTVVLLVGRSAGCQWVPSLRRKHRVVVLRLRRRLARAAALRPRWRHQSGHRPRLGLQPRAPQDVVPPARRERVESTVELDMGPILAEGPPFRRPYSAEASVGGLDYTEDPIAVSGRPDGRSPQGGRGRRRCNQRQGAGVPRGRGDPGRMADQHGDPVWEQPDEPGHPCLSAGDAEGRRDRRRAGDNAVRGPGQRQRPVDHALRTRPDEQAPRLLQQRHGRAR